MCLYIHELFKGLQRRCFHADAVNTDRPRADGHYQVDVEVHTHTKLPQAGMITLLSRSVSLLLERIWLGLSCQSLVRGRRRGLLTLSHQSAPEIEQCQSVLSAPASPWNSFWAVPPQWTAPRSSAHGENIIDKRIIAAIELRMCWNDSACLSDTCSALLQLELDTESSSHLLFIAK